MLAKASTAKLFHDTASEKESKGQSYNGVSVGYLVS